MKDISTILVLIIVVAIVAVIVSKNSQSATLISSVGDAFNNIVKTAVGPISGSA